MPEGYKCDKCGAGVGEADTKCPQCGEPFEEEKKLTCKFCGADVKEGDLICRKCGRPLSPEMAGPSLSGVGLMVLGGLIYLAAFIYSMMAPSPGSTVEELGSQLKDARNLSMIGALGTFIFMFGSVLQCLSLFMAAKAQQPKK
jgi:hypothetical protein